MKKLSELIEEYFKNPNLLLLEEKRKKLLFRLKFIAVFTLLVAVIVILYFNIRLNNAFFVLFAAFGVYMFVYRFLIKGYKKEFKETVVKSLVSIFTEAFEYRPDGKVDSVKYDLSGIFPQKYDRYSGEDYVKGELNGVGFEFSDLHTEYESRDVKGNVIWQTVFKGTFYVSEFNRHFKGRVVVYPDFAEKYFGNIANTLQKLHNGSLEFVKMDSPEFEKEFKVYSDDQILARYVLSTSFMEKMVIFKRKIKKPVYFSVKNNMMFVAISGNDNFEAPVWRSLMNYKYVEEMLGSFYYISTLVNSLSLERKIWKN